MGPIWGRQDPGGPRVGPMNFAIWDPLCWNPLEPLFFLVEEGNSQAYMATDER